METIIKKSREAFLYKRAVRIFQKQYHDVQAVKKLFVNSDNTVYAGEWIDHAGITHCNSGYAPDHCQTIIFEP